MRKGFLGSIAALAAGAGAAWGQPGVPPKSAPPAGTAIVAPGPVAPIGPPPPVTPPAFGGFPANAIPGNSGYAPPPVILPPGNYGPPGDPLGLGPVGGFGPPPAPMYPVPGPYAQQSWQPPPNMPNVSGGDRGLGYGSAPHWWFEGEYLLWFTKGQPVNFPLLTTSAPSDAGMLGAASTTVLVGQRDLGYNAINGFRLTSGFFGDADRRFGFQMTGFLTERRTNVQTFGDLRNTAGIPTFARPFIDVAGVQSTVVLSGPEFGPAVVKVGANTQTWGVEPEAIWNLYRAEPGTRAWWSLDFIAGYRFIQMKEELFVQSTTQLDTRTALPVFQNVGPFGVITLTGVNVVPATTTFGGVLVSGPAVINIQDNIRATNRFNGAVFGLKAEGRYGIFTTSSFAKVAIGNMHQRVEITGGGAFVDTTNRSGSSATNIPALNNLILNAAVGGNGSAVGGLLANASNIGTFVHDRFSYIPEVGGNVGIALTRGLTGYIGVNLLYFPDVVRPGTIVSPLVSSAAVPFSPNYGAPGAPRAPGFRFIDEDHWLGGVNFGFMLRY
jgi:hypothetical protein